MATVFLPAGAAERWLACPPSAMLSSQEPWQPSAAGSAGITAKNVAETRLGELLDAKGIPCEWSHQPVIPLAEGYDRQMEDNIAVYVRQMMRKIRTLYRPEILLRPRVGFGGYVPGSYARPDVVMITADGFLTVVQIRYGSWEPEASGNPVLRVLGIGALLTARERGHQIHTVTLVSAMPKLNSFQKEVLSASDLTEWAETIRPAAQMAASGEGEFAPGEHCRFCPAKAHCSAYIKHSAGQTAQSDARKPGAQEIIQIISQFSEIRRWMQNVEAQAASMAAQGRSLPGMKLVREAAHDGSAAPPALMPDSDSREAVSAAEKGGVLLDIA